MYSEQNVALVERCVCGNERCKLDPDCCLPGVAPGPGGRGVQSEMSKLSCNSHPNRTEFDCYRCGFEQADTYRELYELYLEKCEQLEARLDEVCERCQERCPHRAKAEC
jgi:hypothetical protein